MLGLSVEDPSTCGMGEVESDPAVLPIGVDTTKVEVKAGFVLADRGVMIYCSILSNISFSSKLFSSNCFSMNSSLIFNDFISSIIGSM